MNRSPQREETGAQLAPGDERRRSQRVVIRIHVTLHYALHKQSGDVPAYAVAVNDHGALLICSRDFPSGTRLELQHDRTRQRRACRVTRHPRETPDGFQIPVEFDTPATGFWEIAFPPPDWKPVED